MPNWTSPVLRRTAPPKSLIRWGDASILAAWMYAERLHRGQVRPKTTQPYILHPFAVCKLLRRFNAPRPLLQAALLHDVVEDQEASLLEIADRFSPAVATLVLECSKVTTAADGPRAHRHRIEVQRMRSMSPDGQSIKLADIACNAISIVRRDRAFAQVYLPEKMDELAVLHSPSIPVLETIARRIVLRAIGQLHPRSPHHPLAGRDAVELGASLDLMSMAPRPVYTSQQSQRANAPSPS